MDFEFNTRKLHRLERQKQSLIDSLNTLNATDNDRSDSDKYALLNETHDDLGHNFRRRIMSRIAEVDARITELMQKINKLNVEREMKNDNHSRAK